MPKSILAFDQINIPAPCDADWDSMIGNEQVRFCEHCNLHVTNLSAMTRQEAMRLVERSKGRLCVRFVTGSTGDVLTKQLPRTVHQIARRASRIAAGAFSATLSLSSAVVQAQSGVSPEARRETAVAAALATPLAHEAALSGTVTDSTGAVVMGANVILSKKGSGAAFVCVTGEDGAYNFSILEPGDYTLVVHASTFASTEPSEISLSPALITQRHVMLQVPEVLEEIEIAVPIERVTMGVMVMSEPESPLIKAASSDDLSALVQLIPTAIAINASDKATNTTALAYAVANGNLEMVQLLLSAGASPNAPNGNGRTSLMHLPGDTTIEFVRGLIGLGFDVDARDDSDRSVLMTVARSGSFAVVKELIDAGAKIDERDQDGNTVLMSAAENSDSSVLTFLIKSGAPLDRKNDDGESATLIAARAGNAENLKALVESGAAIEFVQKDLNDALLLAVRNAHPGMLKLLLKLGAKANAKAGDTTALMLAAEYGTPEMIKALIDEGAEIDAVDDNGWTALMQANEAENVRVLLNAGANVGIKNNNGETALAMAIRYEQQDVVQLLESRGAPE